MMDKKLVKGLFPNYLKEFKCIGSKCEDTCCSGWYISIDEDTYKRYKKVKNYKLKNKFKKNVIRVRSNKSFNNTAKMKMENGSCSFLMNNGLCEIHIELGEEYLCETCKVYPKYTNKIDGIIEKSLTISCPEAARKVLLNREKMEFESCLVENNNFENFKIETNKDKLQVRDYFWELRIFIIELLQNDNYEIEEKLIVLGMVLDKIKESKDVELMVNRYRRYIRSEVLKEEIQKINSKDTYKVSVSKTLVQVNLNRKKISSNYEKYIKKLNEGLQLDKELEISVREYQNAYKSIYEPFMKENKYIFENYLVNYVFKKCIPFDENTIFESYIVLVTHYVIFKIHLIGIGAYNKKIDIDECIEIFQKVSRVFEHDKKYFKGLLEDIKKHKYDNLANMVGLIKG